MDVSRRVAVVLVALTAMALAPSDRLTRATGATVLVKVGRFSRNRTVANVGSGFFVDGRGHVVTSADVVAPDIAGGLESQGMQIAAALGGIEVVAGSGRPGAQAVPATVIRLDRHRGLALLEVPLAWPDWIDLSMPVEAVLGGSAMALGYSGASGEGNPVVAVIRAQETSGGSIPNEANAAFALDAAIPESASGGPVLDEAGDLIGIVVPSARGATATARVIPAATLSGFVAETLAARPGAVAQPGWAAPAARASGAVPLPGNEPTRRTRLTQLASPLQAHTDREQNGLVVTNSNVGEVAFVVNEARYVGLSRELRAVALEFDRAEFRLGPLTVAMTYGSATASSAPSGEAASGPFLTAPIGRARAGAAATESQESGQEAPPPAGETGGSRAASRGPIYRPSLSERIANARTALEASRARVRTAQLCRCPDNRWFRVGGTSARDRCVVP
jgi:S1-C subfamily serine protease